MTGIFTKSAHRAPEDFSSVEDDWRGEGFGCCMATGPGIANMGKHFDHGAAAGIGDPAN